LIEQIFDEMNQMIKRFPEKVSWFCISLKLFQVLRRGKWELAEKSWAIGETGFWSCCYKWGFTWAKCTI